MTWTIPPNICWLVLIAYFGMSFSHLTQNKKSLYINYIAPKETAKRKKKITFTNLPKSVSSFGHLTSTLHMHFQKKIKSIDINGCRNKFSKIRVEDILYCTHQLKPCRIALVCSIRISFSHSILHPSLAPVTASRVSSNVTTVRRSTDSSHHEAMIR